MPATKSKNREATLAAIARDILFIETLEMRNSDRLDFHDVAVWSVHDALEIAAAGSSLFFRIGSSVNIG